MNTPGIQEALKQANVVFPKGSWYNNDPVYGGDDVKIGYTVGDTYEVYQTVDGHPIGGYVQFMVEGQDVGKYRAYNSDGDLKITKSAKSAAQFAWSDLRKEGWKKQR